MIEVEIKAVNGQIPILENVPLDLIWQQTGRKMRAVYLQTNFVRNDSPFQT